MATAYASVVSLIHLIDQIPIYVSRNRSTIFSEKQLREIKSLKEKACVIQEYLEEASHNSLIRDSNEAQDLKRRIVDASYAAADVIESHIVDDIMASEKSIKEKIISLIYYSIGKWRPRLDHVSEAIQKVIQDMNFILKEVIKIEDLQPNNLTQVDHSLRPHPTMIDHDIMVGFDDHLTKILDKLTGQQWTLQTIPITGMGGIGKTKLAQNIYNNSLIVQHFDILGWITVSQVYNIEKILLSLLHEIGINIDPKKKENSEYHHLGKILYQHLLGRRYLIIVDDLWNTEAWDKLKLFFPDTEGSRIMVTTRLKHVANYVSPSNLHEIYLLDENTSWSLLCRKVFEQEGCPCPELEEVGKKIAIQCQGLPLSIIVIGGLLVKFKMTLDSWEYVADNLNKIISSKDSDCLDILLLSYRHLPIHLQPCFLYVGVYPEDHTILASELIHLWVAEGFLKPDKLKTLEEVAEDYLMDLSDRHLIMVNKWGVTGRETTCEIHDHLRDLCLREAHKEKFLWVNKVHERRDSPQPIIEHRIAIQQETSNSPFQHAFQSTLLVRSLTCEYPLELSLFPNFKLLRIFNVLHYYVDQEVGINLLNLRYLHLSSKLPESICLMHRLWNLQTLVIENIWTGELPILQIWKMPHLRHVICKGCICIPDPPQCDRIEDSMLENLQTLLGVENFKCTEEVVRRIPNIKKLELKYKPSSNKTRSRYYLHNIGLLNKLESLTLNFDYYGKDFIRNIVFPDSLKELSLLDYYDTSLEFGSLNKKIGWLPHLERLSLARFHTKNKWNPVVGQFPQLKVLILHSLYDLVYWNADSVHFPFLEHLHLTNMGNLKEIPSGIGEIATLQSITVVFCNASVDASAENILEEQRSFGNEGLRLDVYNNSAKLKYMLSC